MKTPSEQIPLPKPREISLLGLHMEPAPRHDQGSETGAHIAVLIPCYNEAITIGEVVRDFARHLPQAEILVYDNNSSDDTAKVAAAAGAQVRHEPLQGKGNVVRRMFADVDADVYVLVDGDGTYDAASAPRLVGHLLRNNLDLVNAARTPISVGAFPSGHTLGNRGFSSLVAGVFGKQVRDMLSGYRVMSRRFVKSFPALSRGFETETELVVHALDLRLPIGELETPYRQRPDGSESKLHTVRDGTRILKTILALIKDERPLAFFSTIGALLMITSFAISWPLLVTYLQTHLVPRLPTAVLAMGITILACISVVAGLVLDTVTHGRREMKRLHYLALSQQPRRDFLSGMTRRGARQERELGRAREL